MEIPGEFRAKADPELIRELQETAADALVDAVLVLDATNGVLDAGAVEEAVRALLGRAEFHTGETVTELTIFSNLASFLIRAVPELIEELIEQPEVGSAVANRQSDSPML